MALNLLDTMVGQGGKKRTRNFFRSNPEAFGENTAEIRRKAIGISPTQIMYPNTKKGRKKLRRHQSFRDWLFKAVGL